jgi:hypothetical protein
VRKRGAHIKNARYTQRVGQLQVKADQIRLTMRLDRRCELAQVRDLHHLGAGAQPAQQHDHGFTHQRVIVDHIERHRRSPVSMDCGRASSGVGGVE